MLIITAPGQGAQTPGFLAPWLELPGVAERLGAASELAGCDLIRFGTTASADEIKDTAVAQPLLVAAAIVAASALSDPAPSGSALSGSALPSGVPGEAPADAAAGHSVGELAAGVIGGVLTADDAMRLVAVRGRAMAAAAAAEPTGMTAVLGGDQEVPVSEVHLRRRLDDGARRKHAAHELDGRFRHPQKDSPRPRATTEFLHSAIVAIAAMGRPRRRPSSCSPSNWRLYLDALSTHAG